MVETAVGIDTLGSRFVEMEGSVKPCFELETPVSRFLTKAIKVKVHLNKPVVRGLSESGWERMVDVMIIHTFGKAEGEEALEKRLSLEEIGVIFANEDPLTHEVIPLTGERIRQLTKEGAYYLYQASPNSLKQQYLDLLNQIGRKDELFMANQVGTTRVIAGAVLTGASYQDLRKRFSVDDLKAARNILAEYSLHVPRMNEREPAKKLIEDLKALTGLEDKATIKQVLDRIKVSFYLKYRQERQLYCLTVTDLCQKAGLHPVRQRGDHSLILAVLDDLGIAYGEIVEIDKRKRLARVNFILAVQQQQAIAGLAKEDRVKPLQENPVSQISGQKSDQLPTTWQLQKGEGYGSMKLLLQKLNLPTIGGRNKITTQEWLDSCPVAVFYIISERSCWYPTNQKKQFKSFLVQKYQELRGNLNSH